MKAILEAARVLPSPPLILSRVLELVSGPSHTRARLVELVRSDPGVAGEVLRIANTAYFNRRSVRIGDLDEALLVLGEDTLVQLVMSQALRCLQIPALPGYTVEGGLWQQSLRAASAAALLSQGREGALSPHIAYTTGLLIDVGLLALAVFLTLQVNELLSSSPSGPEAGCWELDLEDLDHGELGAMVAGSWGLPDALVRAVRLHHRPEGAPGDTLVAIAHAAAVIADRASAGRCAQPLSPAVAGALSLDEARLSELVDQVNAATRHTSELLAA
jgi:HD-like signal output (HDOD) protein